MSRKPVIALILCAALAGCGEPAPTPRPTAVLATTAVATRTSLPEPTPTPTRAATATPSATPAPSATPPPTPTAGVVRGPAWVPPEVDSAIAIHTRAFEYTRSGRPAGMDDPARGCNIFDDSRPVILLTATLRIYNRSDQEMRDWYAYFYTPSGTPLYTCHQAFEQLPVLPPGHYVDVTFGAFMEEGGIKVRGHVFDRAVGRSNEVVF
jgi:hypothetical protein